MRRLLLALVFASSASAQSPDSTAARRSGPSAALVAAGAGAGVAAFIVGSLALKTVGASTETGTALLLYPAGAAAGVFAAGRSQGRHGTLRGASVGAFRGTLVAVGGILLAGYGAGSLLNGSDDNNAVVLAGLAIALVAPPVGAAAGYSASDVQPVVLVAPDGERAAGLMLRVSL